MELECFPRHRAVNTMEDKFSELVDTELYTLPLSPSFSLPPFLSLPLSLSLSLLSLSLSLSLSLHLYECFYSKYCAFGHG